MLGKIGINFRFRVGIRICRIFFLKILHEASLALFMVPMVIDCPLSWNSGDPFN